MKKNRAKLWGNINKQFTEMKIKKKNKQTKITSDKV